MEVVDILAFVPSKNFEASKAFYSEIGFQSEFVNDDLWWFKNGNCSFFLQDFYNKELANNFMLQVCVSDINEAFKLCSASKHKTRISEITQESWAKVFYLWGPAGELLHVTELNR